MLALDHKKLLHERYNIINGMVSEILDISCKLEIIFITNSVGTPIAGESSSGFKEGRRAVVQTFSHIDTITNVRFFVIYYARN